jgi:hypothetical protein
MTNNLTFPEFFKKIEHAISEVIMDIIQDNLNNWDEDYITLDILKAIRRNFREVTIQYSKKKLIKIKTNFFKFNRKLKAEEKYGDIAIIVNLDYDDGESIKGVGLIEAKRINAGTFSAIKVNQLDRIYKNAPHAYLMLYDHERIDKDENFKNYLGTKSSCFDSPLYASLVPINLARKFHKFNRKLYRFSTAFSYQFAYRYIHGLDLEFSDDIIQAAKGYQLNERYPPQHIIQISVKHTQFEDAPYSAPSEINTENFTEITNP